MASEQASMVADARRQLAHDRQAAEVQKREEAEKALHLRAISHPAERLLDTFAASGASIRVDQGETMGGTFSTYRAHLGDRGFRLLDEAFPGYFDKFTTHLNSGAAGTPSDAVIATWFARRAHDLRVPSASIPWQSSQRRGWLVPKTFSVDVRVQGWKLIGGRGSGAGGAASESACVDIDGQLQSPKGLNAVALIRKASLLELAG